ncbi:MFS transporter [Pseudonocardia acaciae]|uniref:MFS transporter n=1 Tax=Pseudonocardia acaciae TaxID=551276 RepID=UPI000A5B459A|nr:MFS transporter [Pseudonocardia acaciae]
MPTSNECPPTEARTTRANHAVVAAAIGNVVEWFDFALYSYLATTIGKVFFPRESSTAQLLSTFAVLAASFVFRPLGGIVLGSLGDRIGRRAVLSTTILLMTGSTFCVGLIPSYSSIGIGAPLLLVLLRMVQGFSTGGEYGSAATFIAEYAPARRRGMLSSLLEVGSLCAFGAGAAAATLITLLVEPHQLVDWAWRLPFFVAAPLGIVAVYLRLRLDDTPVFKQAQESGATSGTPLRDAVRRDWRAMLDLVGIVILYNGAFYTILTYLPTYLSNRLGISESTALSLSALGMLGMAVVVPFLGALSDRIGRKPVMIASCALFITSSYLAFRLLERATPLSIAGGIVLLALPLAALQGIVAATLPALFPTQVRCGAFSLGYNVSTALFGGTAPLVMQFLITTTGSNSVPAYYLMAAAAIALVPILRIPETAGASMHTVAQPQLGRHE